MSNNNESINNVLSDNEYYKDHALVISSSSVNNIIKNLKKCYGECDTITTGDKVVGKWGKH